MPAARPSTGPRLLADARIASAIKDGIAERSRRTRVSADAVLEKLVAVALGDVRALFNPDGTLKPVHELSEEAAANIASLDVVTTINKDGVAVRTTKLRLNDRLRALELLSRHLGLFE